MFLILVLCRYFVLSLSVLNNNKQRERLKGFIVYKSSDNCRILDLEMLSIIGALQ